MLECNMLDNQNKKHDGLAMLSTGYSPQNDNKEQFIATIMFQVLFVCCKIKVTFNLMRTTCQLVKKDILQLIVPIRDGVCKLVCFESF